MNEKQIKRSQKIRMSFLEATKEIIKMEGVENVSVRKVADMAGYTYAAIYNYFADVNELLRETKSLMVQETMAFMMDKFPAEINCAEDFKTLCRRYIGYYLEYPRIFKFFYLYLHDPDKQASALEYGFINANPPLKNLVSNGILTEAEACIIMKTVIYALHGALILHFSGNGVTKEDMYQDIDSMVCYLLKSNIQ